MFRQQGAIFRDFNNNRRSLEMCYDLFYFIYLVYFVGKYIKYKKMQGENNIKAMYV